MREQVEQKIEQLNNKRKKELAQSLGLIHGGRLIELTDEEYNALMTYNKKHSRAASNLRVWSIILLVFSLIAAVILIAITISEENDIFFLCAIGQLFWNLPLSCLLKVIADIADKI